MFQNNAFNYIVNPGLNKDKLKIAQDLTNTIKFATNFDVEIIIHNLITTKDKNLLARLFSILTSFVVNNNRHVETIACNLLLYRKVCAILNETHDTQLILCVLNFISSLLHTDGCVLKQCKDAVVSNGLLKTFCHMFMINSNMIPYWHLICQCIGETCRGDVKNQKQCSHLIPISLSKLKLRICKDIVSLINSLIENNNDNKMMLVEYDCMDILFKSSNMNDEVVLELFATLVDNCRDAAGVAFNNQLPSLLTKILLKHGKETHIGKWCSIAFHNLQSSLQSKEKSFNSNDNSIDFNFMYNNESTTISNEYTNKYKYIMQTANSTYNKTNKKKTLHDDTFKTKTINGNSMDSAIGRFSNINIRKNERSEDFNTQENDKIPIKLKASNGVGVYRNKEQETHNAANLTGDVKLRNDFSFNVSKNSKRKIMHFNQFEDRNKILKEKSNDQTIINTFNTSSSKIQRKTNKADKDLFVNTAVKQFGLDMNNQSKTFSIRNDSSFINPNRFQPILTSTPRSHKTNKFITHSFVVSKSKRNKKTSLNESMSSKIAKSISNSSFVKSLKGFLSWNITKKDDTQTLNGDLCSNVTCVTCNDTEELQIKLNSNDSLKDIYRKLKFGIKIYGCNFQKIAKVYWPHEEYITPNLLYKLYKKLIIKN